VECTNEGNNAKEIATDNKRMPRYLIKTMRRNALRYYARLPVLKYPLLEGRAQARLLLARVKKTLCPHRCSWFVGRNSEAHYAACDASLRQAMSNELGRIAIGETA
jgi:hypothetical protein